MKKLSLIIALFITNIFSTVKAQVATASQSLLWEITGKELTKPSYVFGTFHIMCESDFLLKEKVITSLSKTDQLAFEVNYTDPEEMKVMQSGMLSTQKLSSNLNEQQIALLDSSLRKYYQLTLQQADHFSNSQLISLLALKSVGCCRLKSYELNLLKQATKENKPVIGLEKAKDQMEAINRSYTTSNLATLLSLTPEYKQMIKEATELYKAEKHLDLAYVMNDPRFTSDLLQQHTLTNRNQNWANRMPTVMRHKSTFFAVGAAHLAGENGVIQLLINQGYTLKPVLN